MARKTSGDSSLGVSGIIFRRIQDSFTTQGFAFKGPVRARFPANFGSAPQQPRRADIRADSMVSIFQIPIQ
jgi:hypothetical protein